MAVDQSQPLLLASRFIGCDLLLVESRVTTNKQTNTHSNLVT